MDLNHDPGTSVISLYVYGKESLSGAQIVRDLLRRSGLSEPDEIGTLSFDRLTERETQTLWGYTHAYLNEQKTIREIIGDFCFQRNYMLYFDSSGKANIKAYWYSATGNYSPYYSKGDLEEGTRELSEDKFLEFHAYKDATHVFNRTQTLYHYCPYGNLYTYFGEENNKSSQTRLGYTRTKRNEASWLWGTLGHFRQDWMGMGRFRYPIYKSKFKLPMSELPLELGDYVQINHSKTPNEYGTQGWNQKQMEIVSLEEDYDDKTINIETWEWGLPIPAWRLMSWFSLAEGEGTQIRYEFHEDRAASGGKQEHFTTSGTETSFWDNKINNDYILTLNGSDQFVNGLNIGSPLWGNIAGFAAGVYGAFIKPDNLSTQQCIMSCNRLGTNGWEMGINTDGSIYYGVGYINTKTGGTYIEISSPADIISGPGTWQQVCVGPSRKNSGETNEELWVKFYLNGTEVGTFLHVGNYVFGGGEEDSYQCDAIGAANVGTWDGGTFSGCHYFDGQIGDVVAYPVGGTRTPADMEKLYNGLRGRYGL